ncbi:hypothetical protein [uncultured Ferrovibrio sp.]|jgi:hypothetical protein|uniref:hypothetical protein n=1 Tax=uncultured Ferrovibrio sp. TaxID=1576913 RepID=UPI002620B10C|nr:hypothetical protein [uncultured Ferrovibrio sp.]
MALQAGGIRPAIKSAAPFSNARVEGEALSPLRAGDGDGDDVVFLSAALIMANRQGWFSPTLKTPRQACGFFTATAIVISFTVFVALPLSHAVVGLCSPN